MKKWIGLMLSAMMAVQLNAQDNVIDEVVWVVGDEAILKSEVEQERIRAQYEGRKFDGDPYCVIPEELALQKLFLNQAAIDSIEASESEVLSQVDYEINRLVAQIGSVEKMEEYYNKSSMDIREGTRLTTVYLPRSLETIGHGPFGSCENVTDVHYAGSEEEWKAVDKGDAWDACFPLGATLHFNSTP